MLASVGDALGQVDARLRELRTTGRALQVLHGGLATMAPDSDAIPGVDGCACVRLASGRTPGP
ncbi:MAG: hypothetical protein WEC75_06890 [Dehalococcoidia bacterium]